MKKILLLMIIALALPLFACAPQTDAEAAQAFVQQALTMPADEISELFRDSAPRSSDEAEQLNIALQNVVEELYGELMTQDMLSADSAFMKEVITLHAIIASRGEQYSVSSLELSEAGERQFGYVAELHSEISGDSQQLIGSIRLNEEQKIEYMSITSAQP